MFFRNLKWDIVGQRNIWFGVSGIIIIAGIIALFIHHGLPLGLSFTGGSTIDVKFSQSVTEEQVHSALMKMDVNAIDAGDRDAAKQTAIRAEYADIISGAETLQLATKSGDIAQNDRITISTQGAISDPSPIYDTLDKAGFKVDRGQSQNTAVGPSLSKEYLQRSLLALVIALGLQLLYIAFRFGNQLRFGVIADIALLHDVIVMVGIYALANRKADDAFLAALLTVIGYSVMDSIVIFDRIRENGRLMADQPYDKMVNVSLLQTMTRSVYTLATVLIVLFALYFFGGDTLKNFAFALLVGVTSGAYSSIFIASPLLVMWQQRTARARAGAHAAALARESSTRQAPATQKNAQSAARAAETADRAKRAKTKTPTGPPPRYRRMRDRVPASANADGGDDAGTVRSDFENGADADGADEAR
ncbi:MAG TPA: protein translocase subunit SecF [Candidatus Eremiobacteraceae bacterium]|nr:protein translocase subunit SecF [Candidatus Eremiobacteraceae bacterium]